MPTNIVQQPGGKCEVAHTCSKIAKSRIGPPELGSVLKAGIAGLQEARLDPDSQHLGRLSNLHHFATDIDTPLIAGGARVPVLAHLS